MACCIVDFLCNPVSLLGNGQALFGNRQFPVLSEQFKIFPDIGQEQDLRCFLSLFVPQGLVLKAKFLSCRKGQQILFLF